METYKVAIVIPAYNESNTISQVVKSAAKYGIVVVVNDASTDNTLDLAKLAGAVVVSHNENKGYNLALNSGFEKAEELGCDAIITFDADGQHDSNYLQVYIDKLKNGKDLILGVRNKTQRFSEWVFKVYTKIVFSWKDPLCGMKGYSMKLYQDRGGFDTCGLIGTELAIFALLKKYSYEEVNIHILDREDTPKFASTIRSNLMIMKALVKVISGCVSKDEL